MAAAGFCACSDTNDIIQPDTPVITDSAFEINSSILSVSRAPQLDGNGAGKFTDGDTNTLFMKTGDAAPTTFAYTYGKEYHWSDLGLTTDKGEVTFTACYPPVETDTPDLYGWDIRRHTTSADLLLAAPVTVKNGTEQPVALAFTHALHLLKVTLAADGTTMTDADLREAEIGCRNVLSTADVNLLSGKAVSASGEKCSLTAQGTHAEFIVPAQPVGNIELVIRIGGKEMVSPLAQCEVNGQPLTALHSGSSLSMTVTVSAGSFTVSGQEIAGWEHQGDISDTIII